MNYWPLCLVVPGYEHLCCRYLTITEQRSADIYNLVEPQHEVPVYVSCPCHLGCSRRCDRHAVDVEVHVRDKTRDVSVQSDKLARLARQRGKPEFHVSRAQRRTAAGHAAEDPDDVAVLNHSGWEALRHDAAVVDSQGIDQERVPAVIKGTHRARNDVLEVCGATRQAG